MQKKRKEQLQLEMEKASEQNRIERILTYDALLLKRKERGTE